MLEFLHYGFMQRALVSSVVVGTTCSFIGVFVVLRGMAFAGSGLAHAAFGGVALGFLLTINPLFAAVLFCLGTAGLIQVASRKAQLRMDAAIGVFFAFAMALGVLFIGLMRRYDALVVVGAIALLYRPLKFVTFDEEMAEASGLPTRTLAALLLGLLAITVVVSLKTVGIILVEALLVTPAATAYQLTHRYGVMFLLSWIAGVVSCVAGLVISYALGIPSGAAIVVVATALFALAAFFSPKRRKCRVCGHESAGTGG
jgi:ABC-type Mn2+/Zn2+ transport system permease subunit